MTTQIPQAIAAFDDLMELLDGVAEYGDTIASTPAAELALRLRADVRSALDSLLTAEWWRIMDTCADLMEVGLLARRFCERPDEIVDWRVASDQERHDRFGFRALLETIPEGEELPFIGTSRLANMQEYIGHHRQREPAMWTFAPDELSRARIQLGPHNVGGWIHSATAEIIRHAAHATIEMVMWFVSAYPEHEPPGFHLPEPDGPLKQFLAEHYAFLDEHADPNAVDEASTRFNAEPRDPE